MSFHTGLSRDGPGLLVRDLLAGPEDADLGRIKTLAPDVVALQNVDYDFDHVALGLIQKQLAALGHPMPHSYTAAPNTGVDSGFDLDRNGKLGEPRDMLGYGRFSGQGGMVLLSRFPLVTETTHNLSGTLWAQEEQPGLPEGYYSPEELAVLPLHSVGAWDVAVQTPSGLLRILTSHASTPAFDGPEDRNGLRNAAELRFWRRYVSRPDMQHSPFVLVGTLNNDPDAGEGHKPEIRKLLADKVLQDPIQAQHGHLVTAEWPYGLALRVDYVLPSQGLAVRAAGVDRAPQRPEGTRHFPVWVDVSW